MDQFNVEDIFFGALLGAWCSRIDGLWMTDIISFIMLVLLFVSFGVFVRVMPGPHPGSKKYRFLVFFVLASISMISCFYFRIEDSKKQEIVFFALMFAVWTIISLVKVAHQIRYQEET